MRTIGSVSDYRDMQPTASCPVTSFTVGAGLTAVLPAYVLMPPQSRQKDPTTGLAAPFRVAYPALSSRINLQRHS